MVMLHTRGSTTPRNGTNAALDTIISAITGSLTNVVACNNDDAAGFAPSSYVYFPATATTRYLIRIDTPSTTVRAGTILRLTSRMDTNVVATASP